MILLWMKCFSLFVEVIPKPLKDSIYLFLVNSFQFTSMPRYELFLFVVLKYILFLFFYWEGGTLKIGSVECWNICYISNFTLWLALLVKACSLSCKNKNIRYKMNYIKIYTGQKSCMTAYAHLVFTLASVTIFTSLWSSYVQSETR